MAKSIFEEMAELITKKTGILFLTLLYSPKKKSLSGYGDSGVYDISRSIGGCSMSIC